MQLFAGVPGVGTSNESEVVKMAIFIDIQALPQHFYSLDGMNDVCVKYPSRYIGLGRITVVDSNQVMMKCIAVSRVLFSLR